MKALVFAAVLFCSTGVFILCSNNLRLNTLDEGSGMIGIIYGTKYSKGCLPEISLGPFLNTLPHMY